MVEYVRGMEYASAGVSPMHIATPLDELAAAAELGRVRRLFERPLRAPYLAYLAASRVSESRVLVTSAVLRLAIDSGRSARLVSLDACIATRFDEEERPVLYREFERLDVLVVDLDVQVQNRMVPQICMDIYARRVSRPVATLFLCAENVGKMPARYGPEFSSAFASGRVRSVRSVPKGVSRGS